VQKLAKNIRRADGSDKLAAENEAELMYLMAGNSKKSSPLNDETILVQHPSVFCSYADPRIALDITPCEQPVSPIACGAEGQNYGPELMFSHVFPTLDTKYKGVTLGITKVSPSGSKIDEWLKNSGTEKYWWPALEENIKIDHGTIEAFVWYQGEGDMFPEMEMQDYLTKLTRLVDDVRQEIFVAHRKRWGLGGSPTAKFGSRTDIPVVIVELGAWIGDGIATWDRNSGSPGNIIRAQRKYVSDVDSNSILVHAGTNNDPEQRLSQNWHLDAPSQLIIGDRLAKSFGSLLNKNR